MLKILKNLVFHKNFRANPGSSKINLLIELDTFDKGGLQKVVLDSALRFNPDLITVTIVSVNAAGYLAEEAEKCGIKVYALPFLNKKQYYRKIIEERGINLSNSHFSHFGYSILKEYNIPNITFIHNVYAFLSGKPLERFKLDDCNVDLYISVSNNAKRYAVERLGINAAKIITIRNGLILEEHISREKNTFQRSRSEFGLSDSDYVFLNPASYNLHKGHYVMIDAMKKILNVRSDIKILCIGNIIYEPHFHELKDYLQCSGLNEHIIMPGYYPDIESIYPIVDAFLMPSFIEGWSIAMNEAMFYKKPLIMTDTGGAADVIENNDIGILVENEYGDIVNLYSDYLDDMAYNQREFGISEQLSEAMIDFASNREHWKKAGEKGRKKILDHYSLDNIICQYQNVFMKLMGRNTGAINK